MGLFVLTTGGGFCCWQQTSCRPPVMNLNLTDKWMKCLKSEQATNPDAGKEDSVLNLGITMIPVCVCCLINTHEYTDRRRHTLTSTHICSQFNQTGGLWPVWGSVALHYNLYYYKNIFIKWGFIVMIIQNNLLQYPWVLAVHALEKQPVRGGNFRMCPKLIQSLKGNSLELQVCCQFYQHDGFQFWLDVCYWDVENIATLA